MLVELVSECGADMLWYGPLEAFYEANDFTAEEEAQITAALEKGNELRFGDGAAPVQVLRQGKQALLLSELAA